MTSSDPAGAEAIPVSRTSRIRITTMIRARVFSRGRRRSRTVGIQLDPQKGAGLIFWCREQAHEGWTTPIGSRSRRKTLARISCETCMVNARSSSIREILSVPLCLGAVQEVTDLSNGCS